MRAIILLIFSNIFMTAAWYGHLRFPSVPLWAVVLISWCIALPEYALQVPANRIGRFEENYSAPQLKIIQEAISISIFIVFSATVLQTWPKWNEWLAFALIFVAVILWMWSPTQPGPDPHARPPAAQPEEPQ